MSAKIPIGTTSYHGHGLMWQADHSLGEGVFFRRTDRAGTLRRLVVYVVDAFVLLLGTVLIALVCTVVWGDGPQTVKPFAITWLATCFAYLVVLKSSKWGTPGYIVADLKIVTLTGGRPSWRQMSFRLGLALIGAPFLPPLDLFWVGIDNDGQTLRDRYAGTCVVRAKAQPAGRGAIHLAINMATGLCLTFPVVTRPAGADRHDTIPSPS